MHTRLAEVSRELQRKIPAGIMRWVQPSGIHITLKFLGEIDADQVPVVEGQVAKIARVSSPVDINVGRLGAFPNARRPRVVWVGIEEQSGVLQQIQIGLEEELAHIGFEREDRPFSPHLTLGRVRKEARPREVEAVASALSQIEIGDLAQFRAERLSLMRSDLAPTGARYTCLSTARLGGER